MSHRIIVFLALISAFMLGAGEKIMLYPTSAGIKSPDGHIPYMTLYALKTDKPLGCVLVCPGGSYRFRSRDEADPIARKFNALGFHAAVVEYRTAPSVFPAPQQDALRAIRVIRSLSSKYNIAPDKIAMLGFSAGGHLAASTGVLFNDIPAAVNDEIDGISARPDALILCYPVISLAPDFGHINSGKCLFGAKNLTPELQQKYSLHKLVSKETPPVFLWHTAGDRAVPCRNSIEFANAVWQNKGQAELHIFPVGGHGKKLATSLPCAYVWPELAANFLKDITDFPVK